MSAHSRLTYSWCCPVSRMTTKRNQGKDLTGNKAWYRSPEALKGGLCPLGVPWVLLVLGSKPYSLLCQKSSTKNLICHVWGKTSCFRMVIWRIWSVLWLLIQGSICSISLNSMGSDLQAEKNCSEYVTCRLTPQDHYPPSICWSSSVSVSS